MNHPCCVSDPTPDGTADRSYRRVLWAALAVNAAMFAVEIGASVASGSVALLADAADFAGDAANYGLSLAVLPLGGAWRARAALLKGLAMGVYGVLVLLRVGYGAWADSPPVPLTMGSIALLALAANLGVAAILYAYRTGDANMRSVWLCTRNDAIGNIAVLVAAFGVARAGSAWPDLAVAMTMALLGLTAARSVILQAQGELAPRTPTGSGQASLA